MEANDTNEKHWKNDTLNNYWVSGHYAGELKALGEEHCHLNGDSVNRGGEYVMTSRIVCWEWVDDPSGYSRMVVTTKSGTRYTLGIMSEIYSKWLLDFDKSLFKR